MRTKVLRTVYLTAKQDDWFRAARIQNPRISFDDLFEETLLLGMIVSNIKPTGKF